MRYLIALVIFPSCFCIPILCSIAKQRRFLLEDTSNPDNKTLVTITWDNNRVSRCEMFTGKKFHDEVLKIPNDYVFEKPTAENMQIILDDCPLFSMQKSQGSATEDNEYNFIQTFLNSDLTDFTQAMWSFTTAGDIESSGGWGLIYPGTKWCGAGNIAENYDDLGVERDTDMCCREHDHCDALPAGESRHNLTNNSIFTKLSCKCDDMFRICLRKANSHAANTIGNLYFNVLKSYCYKLTYPRKKQCKKFKKTLAYGFVKVCEEYEEDRDAEKVYQWVRATPFEEMTPTNPVATPYLLN